MVQVSICSDRLSFTGFSGYRRKGNVLCIVAIFFPSCRNHTISDKTMLQVVQVNFGQTVDNSPDLLSSTSVQVCSRVICDVEEYTVPRPSMGKSVRVNTHRASSG